jgi:hypothetical protein
MLFAGKVIGADDVVRLITKGPGPPRRIVSGSGANKSSMPKCQMSPLNAVSIGAAMVVFRGRLESLEHSDQACPAKP